MVLPLLVSSAIMALAACEEGGMTTTYYGAFWEEEESVGTSWCGTNLFADENEALDEAALAVAREFVLDSESCESDDSYEVLEEADAYGAFRAAAAAAAGVEKATALAIVLLVIEHGAAPFDDPEVVALCRSLDRASRDSLVTSLEDYFGDFYDTAALELGSLRYALLHDDSEFDEDEVDLWIDVVFFLVIFGAACGLSAALRTFYRLASAPRDKASPAPNSATRTTRRRQRQHKKHPPREKSSKKSDMSSSDDDDDALPLPPVVAPDKQPSAPQRSSQTPPQRNNHHQKAIAKAAPPEAKPPPAPPQRRRRPSTAAPAPAHRALPRLPLDLAAKVDRRSFAEAALGQAKPVAASVKVVPLPPHVGEDDLRARFARYGGVVGARVFGHADPPHGYVDFECRADAVAAAFDAHGRSLFLDNDLGRVACIVRERAASDSDLGPRP